MPNTNNLSRTALRAGLLCALALAPSLDGATAQQAHRAGPADDPEVKGAQRLFTAWIEGQIRERLQNRDPAFQSRQAG